MEKHIKTVDEYGIDREGLYLFSFTFNGTDYCVYKIERDEEYDNLFVGKLLRDVDGSYKLVNVEDSNEKNELTDIVTGIVHIALDDIKNGVNTTKKDVTVDNKNISLINIPSFNKEQSINVSKSYLRTVKKSLTDICKTYFVLNNDVNEDIFENNIGNVFIASDNVSPETPDVPAVEIPVELNLSSVSNNPMDVAVSSSSVSDSDSGSDFGLDSSSVSGSDSDNVRYETDSLNPLFKKEDAVSQNVGYENSPVGTEYHDVDIKTMVEDRNNALFNSTPVVEDKKGELLNNVQVVEDRNKELFNPAPVDSVISSQGQFQGQQDVAFSEKTTTFGSDVSDSSYLNINASKETNLMQALGELSSEQVIPVSDIDKVREFGVDNDVTDGVNKPKTLSKTKGFADNKFVMVFAILLFICACIFLGYEAFKYFSLK